MSRKYIDFSNYAEPDWISPLDFRNIVRKKKMESGPRLHVISPPEFREMAYKKTKETGPLMSRIFDWLAA